MNKRSVERAIILRSMSSDTAGMIAIGAAALAAIALIVCALLAVRLRRIRSAQQKIAGIPPKENRSLGQPAASGPRVK